MKDFFKNFLFKFGLSLFIAILMTVESIAFAWLSTGWSPGEFSIVSSVTKTPTLEMWTYHKTAAGEQDIGWWITNTDSNLEEKKIGNINSATATNEFKTATDFSLYFGTINNLVDEQDNLPVYLKVKFSLPAGSKNTVEFDYSLPDNYLKLYLVKTVDSQEVGYFLSDTDANSLSTTLNVKENYPFLNLQYYYKSTPVSTNDSGYSIDNEDTSLPEGFEDLFVESTTNTNLHTKTEGKDTFDLYNNTNMEKYVYVYFKFSVPTKTLQKALLETDLKSNMPMYLIFDVNFGISIQTVSQSIDVIETATPEPSASPST